LNQGGLAEEKILRIAGLSDSIPYNPADPDDPMNRRISIIVMNKKTEQHVFQEAGTKSATHVNNMSAPLTKTPSDRPLNAEITPLPDKH